MKTIYYHFKNHKRSTKYKKEYSKLFVSEEIFDALEHENVQIDSVFYELTGRIKLKDTNLSVLAVECLLFDKKNNALMLLFEDDTQMVVPLPFSDAS